MLSLTNSNMNIQCSQGGSLPIQEANATIKSMQQITHNLQEISNNQSQQWKSQTEGSFRLGQNESTGLNSINQVTTRDSLQLSQSIPSHLFQSLISNMKDNKTTQLSDQMLAKNLQFSHQIKFSDFSNHTSNSSQFQNEFNLQCNHSHSQNEDYHNLNQQVCRQSDDHQDILNNDHQENLPEKSDKFTEKQRNLNSQNQIELLLEDSDDSEDSSRTNPQTLRTSTRSKVNFSRLNDNEKIQRLQKMANKIKKLKQRIRSLKSYRSKKLQKLMLQQQNQQMSQIISQTQPYSGTPLTQQPPRSLQGFNTQPQSLFEGSGILKQNSNIDSEQSTLTTYKQNISQQPFQPNKTQELIRLSGENSDSNSIFHPQINQPSLQNYQQPYSCYTQENSQVSGLNPSDLGLDKGTHSNIHRSFQHYIAPPDQNNSNQDQTQNAKLINPSTQSQPEQQNNKNQPSDSAFKQDIFLCKQENYVQNPSEKIIKFYQRQQANINRQQEFIQSQNNEFLTDNQGLAAQSSSLNSCNPPIASQNTNARINQQFSQYSQNPQIQQMNSINPYGYQQMPMQHTNVNQQQLFRQAQPNPMFYNQPKQFPQMILPSSTQLQLSYQQSMMVPRVNQVFQQQSINQIGTLLPSDSLNQSLNNNNIYYKTTQIPLIQPIQQMNFNIIQQQRQNTLTNQSINTQNPKLNE